MLWCEFYKCKLNYYWEIIICFKYFVGKVLISFLYYVERKLYYKEIVCVKNNMIDMLIGILVLI